MPKIKINDIDIYYEIHGQGEPVMIINGLGSDLSEMTRISQPLAEHFQVIIFDNRGAGRTDKPNQPYSIEQMAEDATGLMKALKLQRVYVMGISMGGRIALELTIKHPELVKKLVLVSTSARVIKTWRRLILWLHALAPIGGGQYPQPRYAFIRQFRASSAYNCSAQLGQIQTPTLITHGHNDRLVPENLINELHSGIENSQLATLAGGHLFFLFRDRANFLNKAIQFLVGG